jgi:hypothetical protein
MRGKRETLEEKMAQAYSKLTELQTSLRARQTEKKQVLKMPTGRNDRQKTIF